MLFTALALSAFALPAPTTTAPTSAPITARAEDHGKVPWFTGTFDEALAQAKAKHQMIMIDFWTDWCVWCKRLDKDTYSDDGVVASLKDIICVSIDAESKTGEPVAKKFAIQGYPALFVLDSNGVAQDMIGGYLPPDKFKTEIARVSAGKGTIGDLTAQVEKDPKNIDLRWNLVKKQRDLGSNEAADAQMAEIKKLDPEGKSLPIHRSNFDAMLEKISAEAQTAGIPSSADLEAFLAKETYGEILWEGWMTVANIQSASSNQAKGGGDDAKAKQHKANVRDALCKAWKHVPDEAVEGVGTQLSVEFWSDRDDLTAEHKATALDAARRVSTKAEGKDAEKLDTLACCLFMNGKKDEALQTIDKAIAIDNANADFKTHKALFQTGS